MSLSTSFDFLDQLNVVDQLDEFHQFDEFDQFSQWPDRLCRHSTQPAVAAGVGESTHRQGPTARCPVWQLGRPAALTGVRTS